MKNRQMLTKIKRAKSDIAVAEVELGKVIGALRALPRSQKVTVSKVVDEAFEKLKSAKEKLGELEKALLALVG